MAGERAPGKGPVRDVVDYELLFDCVHCGLCLEACPTYVLTRAEMDSPRGRIYLMKALAEGRLELDADAVRHLDLCLGCRACETACPSGVQYGKLIERARDYVARNHRRPLGERLLRGAIGEIFPFPGRLRPMLAPVRAVERIGLGPALRRLAPGRLGEWLDLLPAPEERSGPADDALPACAAAEGVPTVAMHRGCVARVVSESANRNTERALASAGYRVVPLEEAPCCGALDLHGGNLARARRLARSNVRAIVRSGASAVVSAASGCAAAVAEYGYLLKADPETAEAARAVAAAATDLSVLLLSRGFSPKRAVDCTVTYHDACHLAHGLRVREEPRRLLRAIPGVRLVELNESDMCCGSAGSYNLTEPEMARELVRRKADNILKTGADYVIMNNPGCELQIASELRRRNARASAIHLADFLARAGVL